MTIYLLWAKFDYEGSELCAVYSQRLFAEIRQKQLTEERAAWEAWYDDGTYTKPEPHYDFRLTGATGFKITERIVEG